MAANPSDVSLGYCSGLKAKGNAAFKAGEIEKAIALYSEVSRVCTLSTHTPHFCCLLNHHHNHNTQHTHAVRRCDTSAERTRVGGGPRLCA
jgi:hypothetical protein